MEIKRFEEKYNQLVNEFIISVFLDEFGFEQYREILTNEANIHYQQNGGDFWICLDNEEKIIGTIALEKAEDDKMVLKKMYVDSNYRGHGIAQQLFDKALDYCTKNEVKTISLGTFEQLERAIGFYLKNGFKEVEELRREDGARFFELAMENII